MSDLYFEVAGDGPDLVLLHGWGLNLRVWDNLAQHFRSRFRVITIDLPGHGRSPWGKGQVTPAEQAWLIHQTLEPLSDRYSLLGWSMGGQIALDLAAATPGQIDRLVLVATTPKFAAGPDWPHGMPRATISRLATQLRTDYKRTVSDFLELQVRGSIEAESMLAQLRNALFVHGEALPDALAAGLNRLATVDLRPTLPHVLAPTLVVSGQYDRITLPAASRAMAEALPDAKYVEIHRAAHTPFLSHRAEFAMLLEEFLPATPVMPAPAPDAAAAGTLSGAPGAAGDSAATPRRKPKKQRVKARARKKPGLR